MWTKGTSEKRFIPVLNVVCVGEDKRGKSFFSAKSQTTGRKITTRKGYIDEFTLHKLSSHRLSKHTPLGTSKMIEFSVKTWQPVEMVQTLYVLNRLPGVCIFAKGRVVFFPDKQDMRG